MPLLHFLILRWYTGTQKERGKVIYSSHMAMLFLHIFNLFAVCFVPYGYSLLWWKLNKHNPENNIGKGEKDSGISASSHASANPSRESRPFLESQSQRARSTLGRYETLSYLRARHEYPRTFRTVLLAPYGVVPQQIAQMSPWKFRFWVFKKCVYFIAFSYVPLLLGTILPNSRDDNQWIPPEEYDVQNDLNYFAIAPILKMLDKLRDAIRVNDDHSKLTERNLEVFERALFHLANGVVGNMLNEHFGYKTTKEPPENSSEEAISTKSPNDEPNFDKSQEWFTPVLKSLKNEYLDCPSLNVSLEKTSLSKRCPHHSDLSSPSMFSHVLQNNLKTFNSEYFNPFSKARQLHFTIAMIIWAAL